MTLSREDFIDEQLRLLGPFDFFVVVLADRPFAAIELACDEHGLLQATLGPRPADAPITEQEAAALRDLGFVEHAPVWTGTATPERPVSGELVRRVLVEVFGVHDGVAIDMHHGSRRAEHEASAKVATLRDRLRPLLTELVGSPPKEDEDGDFVFDWSSTQVFVATRAIPGGPIVIRIFAITNIGVSVSPELALFIARMNFGLVFGRFALDLEHAAVWFIETLLGELVSDEEFRSSVRMVAETADEWDDRIAQMFGGFTRATAPTADEPQTKRLKPGEGGYL